jgi:hypothetical protein
MPVTINEPAEAENGDIQQLAAKLAEQNSLVLISQGEIFNAIKALMEQLAQRETIVIPAPEVTVKAADITIPQALPAQVTVMEAPEGTHKIKLTIVRDNRGVMTEIKGTID